MARPVTLFTGQWADLPLETLCKKARDFGYDGLELACWGDHFEVEKAVSDDTYCARKRDLLEKGRSAQVAAQHAQHPVRAHEGRPGQRPRQCPGISTRSRTWPSRNGRLASSAGRPAWRCFS